MGWEEGLNMSDESHLDSLYFVDAKVYNCPFCRRGHVRYSIVQEWAFDWTENTKCYGYVAECHSCEKKSMHLAYEKLEVVYAHYGNYWKVPKGANIDERFFFSVPTSFFTLDSRIPRVLRELISEADGCLTGNFLTGASACVRKVVYELAKLEETKGDNYEERIKSLKKKYPSIEPAFFDTLLTIQKVTSSKVHEEAYDGWTSQHLRLLLASLREVLRELYVAPAERKARRQRIQELGVELLADSNGGEDEEAADA